MNNDYEIRGKTVAIFLNRRDGVNVETIIDLCDLEKVKSFKGKWYATTKKNIDGYYVNGSYEGPDRKTIYLHRFLLDAPKGYHVDHINHVTLDNTRKNLRITTPAENHQNRITSKNNKNGARGVNWIDRFGKWKAIVRVGNGKRFERFFDSKEDAIECAKKARKVYMPFSKDALEDKSNYSEEDLLNEYKCYSHHKKITSKNSSSGYRCISWHKKYQKWQCVIRVKGKSKFIGYFKNIEDAVESLKKAEECYKFKTS